MGYCILADILEEIPETELIQLSDFDNADVVDEVKVAACINKATALIESYARGRYPLPLSPVPDEANRLCVDITKYFLYGLRTQSNELVTKRYDDAVAHLKNIAKGIAHWPQADGEEPPSEGGPQASKTTDDRVFSDDTLENF